MKKHVGYIGIIVFRLLKHSDELDIKHTNPQGYTTLLLGGRLPVSTPGYGPAESTKSRDTSFVKCFL